jgi:hypothetical protein
MYIWILIYVCINVFLVDIFSEHNCPGNLDCLVWQCLCEAVRNVALRRNFLEFDISVVYVLSKLENASVDVLGALAKGLVRARHVYTGGVVLEDDCWFGLFSIHP